MAARRLVVEVQMLQVFEQDAAMSMDNRLGESVVPEENRIQSGWSNATCSHAKSAGAIRG